MLDGRCKSKCELFLNMKNECCLSKHDREISRPASNNISDLILTDNPGSVSHVTCQSTMLLSAFLISCLNVVEGLRELSLCMAKQIGIAVQKQSISIKYILAETLICTQLKTIVFLFKHQLKTRCKKST